MIKIEAITISGAQYRRTYSDIGLLIECGGVRYSEAVDPVGSNRTYAEVDDGTGESDITGEELLDMLEGLL